ncbi:MAG: DHH family phosphoesterase, partial [Patescibacteria group bacterium]
MRWQLKEKAPAEFLAGQPEYPLIVLQLLYDRGLSDQTKIDEFFNPDYVQDLHDPFLLRGVEQAVARLKQAAGQGEPIAIFGDYDADGVCGAMILKTALEKIGAIIDQVYIPDRLIEGYGLNKEAVKKIAKGRTKVVVTIDCGIANVAEVALANSLGLEVIVVDHHQVGEELPKASAVIDPWQQGDTYPFKELAGAGVAFKLAQALLKNEPGVATGWEKWLLDLVALATVADCMPLLGENRTLVRYGLVVLAQTQRLGLIEL